MKNNPFLNKEVQFKRVIKGLKIGLPVVIMAFVIGNYYMNLIDDYFKDKYAKERIVYVENKDVLGAQAEYQDKWKEELDKLTKDYGIDDYVWEWDGELEEYDRANPYIEIPKYYLSGDTTEINQTWKLSKGYKLELTCPKGRLSEVIAGDPYSCTLKYNGVIVSDNVRNYISTLEDDKSNPSYVDFIVYSPHDYEDRNDYEYIIVGSYYSGLWDDASVFSLEDGKAKRIPFYFENKFEDVWLVESPLSVALFYNKEGIKLVTGYHEPSMLVRSVWRVWNIGKESLTLERTFGDILDYDK